MNPDRTHGSRRPLRLLVALGVLSIGLAGCADDEATRAEPVRTPGPVGSVDPSAVATTTVAAPLNFIATAKAGVAVVKVHSSPNGPIEQLDIDENGTKRDVEIKSPTDAQVAAVFMVKQAGLTAGGSTWHEVYLPVRPNGSTGYIADTDVDLTSTDLSIHVSLSAHTLTVEQGSRPIISYRIAVGTAANPTPTGLYYIKELVAPADPKGVYGPLAFGLSGHSDTIRDSAEFADGVIAIHGTDHPELIGQDVSHGCIRLESEDILDLQKHAIPLGTPVTIAA